MSDYYLVIGENWLINLANDRDLTTKLATTFNATVISIPKGEPSEPDPASAGLRAAKAACSHYLSGVAPVIARAVAENNGALVIRITVGQPPDGGPVDENAPWFLTNSAAITAASYDARYSVLTGHLDALHNAVIGIDPFQMSASLATVAFAGQTVQKYCSGIG
jgi:hypothetical protein